MTTYRQGVENTLKNLVCGPLLSSQQWVNKIARKFPPARVGEWMVNGLAGWVCNKDPSSYTPPSLSPFSGGQCSFPYNVSLEAEVVIASSGSSLTWLPSSRANTPGPIGGFRVNPSNQRQFQVLGNGQWYTMTTLSSGSQAFSGDFRNLNITPTGGQEDNCGDPPADLSPDAPITFPDQPITFDDDNGVSVTFNEDVTMYEPYFDVNGDLNISVRIGELFGDLEIFPDFRFSPRINWGGDGVDGPECGPAVDDPPEEEVPLDEPVELPPIIGVFVKCAPSGNETTSSFDQGDAPDLYAPRLANVYFSKATESNFGWSSPHEVKVRKGYVPCPFPEGANKVRVSFAEGWDGNYEVVYEKPPAPEEEINNDPCPVNP